MNGHCDTCPVEKECGYEYKPCDCCDQRKFKPKDAKTTSHMDDVAKHCVGRLLEMVAEMRFYQGAMPRGTYDDLMEAANRAKELMR